VPCGTLRLGHVSPLDWIIQSSHHAQSHSTSLSYNHVSYPESATSAFVQPSHLPSQLPRQHLYCPVTFPCQHRYCHFSSILPHVDLSLGHVSIRTVPFVLSVQCHVSIFYWSTSTSENAKTSDTCHLLVLPCVPNGIIMM
jgi:hypothetical protein